MYSLFAANKKSVLFNHLNKHCYTINVSKKCNSKPRYYNKGIDEHILTNKTKHKYNQVGLFSSMKHLTH